MWFWLKISICQSSMVHEGCWGNCSTRVGNFEASTVCWREATRQAQLSRYQAALDRVCRVAVKNLVLNQESGWQAKKASVSSLDFPWNCHSLFKCIQKNNSPWSPAHMLQMMSCSAVIWSQSYILSVVYPVLKWYHPPQVMPPRPRLAYQALQKWGYRDF